jgi:hypothetical protein
LYPLDSLTEIWGEEEIQRYREIHFPPSPYLPINFSLARVTRIAIRVSSSFFMAVQTPLHIVPVHHLQGPLFHPCETVTDGTIHASLNVNPVGKDDMSRKFIHSLPGDLLACLHILNDFQRLRSLAHRIGGVAGATEFDIGYSCSAVPFHIPVAESTVQTDCFFVMNMIEKNGLIDRYPSIDRKDREENLFGLDLKSMVGNDGKEENENH